MMAAKTANPRQQGLKQTVGNDTQASAAVPKRLIQDNKD